MMIERESVFLGNKTSSSGMEIIMPRVARIPVTTESNWVESDLTIKGAGAGRLDFHLPYIANELQRSRNSLIPNGERTIGEDMALNIQNLLKLKGEDILVDLGMGPGIIAKYLSQYLGEKGWLYCVDASPSMLQTAKAELLGVNATLYHGDIHNVDKFIPNYPKKPDAAILSGNVHLLSNRKLAFRAIYNMLKPEGKLVVVTHVIKNPKKQASKYSMELDRLEETRPDLKVGGLRLAMLTEKELRDDITQNLVKAGFTVQEVSHESDAPDNNEVLGHGTAIPEKGVQKRLRLIRPGVSEKVTEDMSRDVLDTLYTGTPMQTYLLCTKKDSILLPRQKLAA